jgi:hypothetical protein
VGGCKGEEYLEVKVKNKTSHYISQHRDHGYLKKAVSIESHGEK